MVDGTGTSPTLTSHRSPPSEFLMDAGSILNLSESTIGSRSPPLESTIGSQSPPSGIYVGNDVTKTPPPP